MQILDETNLDISIASMPNLHDPIVASRELLVYCSHNTDMMVNIVGSGAIVCHWIASVDKGFTACAISYLA
jgi:hypothetical protein